MNNVVIGLKVLIDSYISELSKKMLVMLDLMSEYYTNYHSTDNIKLKIYYYTQNKQLKISIEQYNNLINTLENFKEKGVELK